MADGVGLGLDRGPQAAGSPILGWRIGEALFDPDQGVLFAPSRRVQLRPKTAAVLRLLAERSGCLVPRAAVMEAVWPGLAVTDDSITQCISEIRCALGVNMAGLLRTVPRRGYMLTCPAVPAVTPEPAQDAPREAPRDGGRQQLAALEARIAQLEALLNRGRAAPRPLRRGSPARRDA